ncbi:MAG: [FeFe] hydrogenase H-cluster maturation GTPase HydF [Verrucomicrobia bacterium]|nr:[FeFe] hydrogenase H-cluster maturation GTPase HydF [Verrucomicrobiota bacterium]MBU1735936.1 [FeFe] hydrogenase H-cluster maturation GTPase HydF [Verrucomicrobiota bacterium]MBU1855600.1 [FeFe] hydrogenase H-cluster maturation GTPase HydF [Verrucomicrobiota bacterium]
MTTIPKSLRLHIGIFGRRNVGKSSVLNALVRQQVSIISDVPGTTTDPVEKTMEFKPIGAVVFIDTAGMDDSGTLGKLRVANTMKVIDRTELAVLVADSWTDYETDFIRLCSAKKIPCVIVANKSDLGGNRAIAQEAAALGCEFIASVSAKDLTGFDKLREAVIRATPREFLEQTTPMDGLVRPDDIVVLVTPIDLEAPKGRLIVPQVQVLRDLLDHNAGALVVKENMLALALANLKNKPALVVTDSQAFKKVADVVAPDILLTSFSIIYARFKGDLAKMVSGAQTIRALADGDKILIVEACSHHPVEDDIGRVKLPRWLLDYTKRNLEIKVVAGRDYPDDLSAYKLVIHCGGCVFNRRELLSRIEKARQAGVPITNYGLAIAFLHGILERALKPFERELTPTKNSE